MWNLFAGPGGGVFPGTPVSSNLISPIVQNHINHEALSSLHQLSLYWGRSRVTTLKDEAMIDLGLHAKEAMPERGAYFCGFVWAETFPQTRW